MDKFEKILDIIDHQEKYADEEIREILQDEECRKLYQTMRNAENSIRRWWKWILHLKAPLLLLM